MGFSLAIFGIGRSGPRGGLMWVDWVEGGGVMLVGFSLAIFWNFGRSRFREVV